MHNRITRASALSLGLLIPVAALAQAISDSLPTPDSAGLGGFAGDLDSAIRSKNYLLFVALALGGIVWAAQKYGAASIPFLQTKLAGVLMHFTASLALSLGAAAAAGSAVTLTTFAGALVMSVMAAGGIQQILDLKDHWSDKTDNTAPIPQLTAPAPKTTSTK